MTPEEEQDNYRKLLKSHDWYYDYSDDHSVWKRGVAARDRLTGLRKQLDTDGSIWNEYAPEGYKVQPVPQKPIAVMTPIKLKKSGGPGGMGGA